MSRWRTSLAALGRIGTVEIQPQVSSLALKGRLTAFEVPTIPDFLAPSLHRRYNASYARAAFGQVTLDGSAETNTTTCLPSSSSKAKTARKDRQRNNADKEDFSTYFDADVPTPGRSLLSSCSNIEEAVDIEARLHAAADEGELARTARAVFHCSALRLERQRVAQIYAEMPHNAARQPDQSRSTLDLNEGFVLHLVEASNAVTRRSGRNDPTLMDQLVARYMRIMLREVPHQAFSNAFLTRLARQASKVGSRSANTVLSLLLRIVQDRLAHDHAGTAAASEGASSSISSTDIADSAQSLSHVVLDLMSGFLRSHRMDTVATCFDLLAKHSLPVTVFHHQVRLIALFRERTSNLKHKHQTDIDRESQEVHKQFLRTKASMTADNIAFDDTFLAAVLHGLSAPLRSPLATVNSSAEAKGTLEMTRIAFSRFSEADQGGTLGSTPRLLAALIGAEIDAVERKHAFSSRVRARTIHRIQALIDQLESIPARHGNPIVASLGHQPFTESQLAGLHLELRLFAVLGQFYRGMKLLQKLLSLEISREPDSAKQKQYLIRKQRSAVVTLFSSAMQRRHDVDKHNAPFEVLNLAFSPTSFLRIWADVDLPSRNSSQMKPEVMDADATVLRLWKRWLRSWSADCLGQGKPTHGANREVELEGQNAPSGKPVRVKYRTYAGKHPWKTLKRSLELLNKVIDQYETMHTASAIDARSAVQDTTSNAFQNLNLSAHELGFKPAPPIAQLSRLFIERNVLDTVVKTCLRGGRSPRRESLQTHVAQRLDLLVNTLTRVHVNGRTWEHVESSLLRHLALIPSDVLPTSVVAPSMNLIEQRKRTALLRNPELRRALQDDRPSVAALDETLPPETGSIFVLRQMLEQRERATRQQQNASAHPRPAFS